MEEEVYQRELENHTHWWFDGRRHLFRQIIDSLDKRKISRILDIGISSGTNLELLDALRLGFVVGIDKSVTAINICSQQGFKGLCRGSVTSLPYADSTYDLILATDILEHVAEDEKALKEINRVLKPQGTLLVTVPCFQALWGLQDDVSHHVRRYSLREISGLIENEGLQIEEHFYFNFLLFVPIYIARRVLKYLPFQPESENQINSPLINRVLTCLFKIDVQIARRWHPPFGVSALVLCKKK